MSRIDGHGPARDVRALAAGEAAADEALRRMVGQAAVLEKVEQATEAVGTRLGDGSVAQEIHTVWNMAIVDADQLGPRFSFDGTDERVRFVAWSLPGQRVIMFIATDELLRAIRHDIDNALGDVAAASEAPAEPAG